MATAKKAARKATKKKTTPKTRSRKADIVYDDAPSEAGTSTLVVVESPAKAKTIGKYLGRG